MSVPEAAVEAAAEAVDAFTEEFYASVVGFKDRDALVRGILEAALPILLAPILALHPKSCEMMGSDLCEWGDECTVLVCGPCGEDWPCPTVKALQ